MDPILKSVQDSFPKFSFQKQQSPSYVSMYTKSKSEVVMVYAKSKPSTTHSENIGKNGSEQAEELELTGSPLKLDLSLHLLDDTLISDEPQLWSKEEATHHPILIKEAREVAGMFCSKMKHGDDALPMWILSNPKHHSKPFLLMVQPSPDHFIRGIVCHRDCNVNVDDVNVENFAKVYAKEEGVYEDNVAVSMDCKYLLSGISYSSDHSSVELLNAPHGGLTELHCEWSTITLQPPYTSSKVFLEQEVIIGHLASPCNAIWKSVSSLYNINQLLVDMTAAGPSSVNLETAEIRLKIPGKKQPNNSDRLNKLLNETETYAYKAECPAGGCICITDDTTTLKQCLSAMCAQGSSNDFTYKLWDILRDCETAEEVITLLIEALKFISSGKIRPFIDANNKTYLSKLVLKLSRGHSQASKVLKNLRSSAPQALSLVAQIGIEKTMWEYTRVMSLLEHSFYIAGIWNTDTRTQESIDQINQTLQDMTLNGGDCTLNPFDSFSTGENSIRLDCESFCVEDPHELTLDDFASLKKHGLVGEKKDVNEVPIIADEIDISPWKNLLMKFAQVHVCLEHLARAETNLRADFANLKPIVSRLLEHYVSEKSPVKTVGQLMSDPVQKISMPVANNVVKDHLKKPAFWYRMELSRNKEKVTEMDIKRDVKTVFVISQLPVFPPTVWKYIEPQTEDVGEETVAAVSDDIKYYVSQYNELTNKIKSKLSV